MAEINMPQKGGRRKVQAPRIDFTPMVDLGFLLITFFMFTTTMANPKTMAINMPSNEHTDEPPVVIAESTITLIATKGHDVIYYEGILNGEGQFKRCSISQLRPVLLRKKNEVAALPSSFSAAAHKMYVLIKPGSDCTYGDIVHLLDEMAIADIQYYTIMDVSAEEKILLQKKF